MMQCTTQIKEREFRGNGSNANTKICSEVRAPSSTSPPSPRRISNPLGVSNSSLNLYNLHRGNTNGLPKTGVPNSTKATDATSTEAIQPQSTSTEEGYTTNPTPPHQEGVNNNLNLYQRGSNPTRTRVYNLVVYLNHKPIPFSTKQ